MDYGYRVDRLNSEGSNEHPLDVADRLVHEIGSEIASEELAELEAEVDDRIQAAWGQLSLQDRLAGSQGAQLVIEVRSASVEPVRVFGVLSAVGSDWCELTAVSGVVIVNTNSVVSVRGLLATAIDSSDRTHVDRARSIKQVLRSVVRSGRSTTVHTAAGGSIVGRIVRVGQDHFDVVVESRSESTQVVCLRTDATAYLHLH